MREYIDKKDNNCWYENVLEWYFIGILGFCGCHSSDLFDDVMKVLMSFDCKNPPYYTKIEIGGDDKYKELILHIMTDKGLLEHGIAVRGSWLTDKGREIIKTIKENK